MDEEKSTEIVEATATTNMAMMPVMSLDEIEAAITAYRALQARIDKLMPEQIVTIRRLNKKTGKTEVSKHRRKGYWQAVGMYFGISTEILNERELRRPDGDWGFIVTAKATGRNGQFQTGDGACFASEKPGRGQATVHNVRSHASTRAISRAISRLCGFGEVSAEEINIRDDEEYIDAEATEVPAAPPAAKKTPRKAPEAPQNGDDAKKALVSEIIDFIDTQEAPDAREWVKDQLEAAGKVLLPDLPVEELRRIMGHLKDAF